ncbi:MAG: hypothetical protein CMD88_05430 [Gammaproteobacteria bacterium]|nr:hypothetical protein [Gammaproteobacteria bacterium]|tara:strand:+ start:1610 stop:1792 length:183 start_codon:yes stop_codon:yes gene_type:complete
MIRLIVILIFYPIDAHAYINPSTVSLVIAAIAGSIAVIGYYARVIYDKIKSFFIKDKNNK